MGEIAARNSCAVQNSWSLSISDLHGFRHYVFEFQLDTVQLGSD
jgi:hypothetical protein